MEKELAEGQVGIGKYDVAFKGGKLVAKLDAVPAAGVSAGVVVELDAAVVLDALALAIPGKIDDAVISLIKSAILA